MEKKKLNGSSNLLADAIRATIQETLDPVIEILTDMEEKNNERFQQGNKRFDNIDKKLSALEGQVGHHQRVLDNK